MRQRRQAGDARFATREEAIAHAQRMLVRTPRQEVEDTIERHEAGAWSAIRAFGIAFTEETPEGVRDANPEGSEGRFLAEILYRARLARNAVAQADPAMAGLTMYSLATAHALWRREIRDGPAIAAYRDAVEAAAKGGAERGRQIAAKRSDWLSRALEIDRGLTLISKSARARKIALELAKAGFKIKVGTIAPVLEDRRKKPQI